MKNYSRVFSAVVALILLLSIILLPAAILGAVMAPEQEATVVIDDSVDVAQQLEELLDSFGSLDNIKNLTLEEHELAISEAIRLYDSLVSKDILDNQHTRIYRAVLDQYTILKQAREDAAKFKSVSWIIFEINNFPAITLSNLSYVVSKRDEIQIAIDSIEAEELDSIATELERFERIKREISSIVSQQMKINSFAENIANLEILDISIPYIDAVAAILDEYDNLGYTRPFIDAAYSPKLIALQEALGANFDAFLVQALSGPLNEDAIAQAILLYRRLVFHRMDGLASPWSQERMASLLTDDDRRSNEQAIFYKTIGLIEAIPDNGQTLSDSVLVEAAKSSYDSLSKAQAEKLPAGYEDKLFRALETLYELKASSSDREKANALDAAARKHIPQVVTENDREAINALHSQYQQLPASAQNQVPNGSLIEEAYKALQALEMINSLHIYSGDEPVADARQVVDSINHSRVTIPEEAARVLQQIEDRQSRMHQIKYETNQMATSIAMQIGNSATDEKKVSEAIMLYGTFSRQQKEIAGDDLAIMVANAQKVLEDRNLDKAEGLRITQLIALIPENPGLGDKWLVEYVLDLYSSLSDAQSMFVDNYKHLENAAASIEAAAQNASNAQITSANATGYDKFAHSIDPDQSNARTKLDVVEKTYGRMDGPTRSQIGSIEHVSQLKLELSHLIDPVVRFERLVEILPEDMSRNHGLARLMQAQQVFEGLYPNQKDMISVVSLAIYNNAVNRAGDSNNNPGPVKIVAPGKWRTKVYSFSAGVEEARRLLEASATNIGGQVVLVAYKADFFDLALSARSNMLEQTHHSFYSPIETVVTCPGISAYKNVRVYLIDEDGNCEQLRGKSFSVSSLSVATPSSGVLVLTGDTSAPGVFDGIKLSQVLPTAALVLAVSFVAYFTIRLRKLPTPTRRRLGQ